MHPTDRASGSRVASVGGRRVGAHPGRPRIASEPDLDVLRVLDASHSSTASLSDLRASFAGRAGRLRDSLWSLEAEGLIEVLESPTCGLICLLTDRGREELEDAPPLGRASR